MAARPCWPLRVAWSRCLGSTGRKVRSWRSGCILRTSTRSCNRVLLVIDDIVLSLSAKGVTTGEVVAHLNEVYGISVSKETISNITDRILGELANGNHARSNASTRDLH